MTMSTATKALHDELLGLPSGPIHDTDRIETLLSNAWGEFYGSDAGGMLAEKIRGRVVDLTWEPPLLSFCIERHGGTVQGSSRAEIQYWVLNMTSLSATYSVASYEQLKPRNPPQDIKPMVATLIEAISNQSEHQWIRWTGQDRFRLLIGNIIPDDAPRKTIQGRRKRLDEALARALGPLGWESSGTNSFARCASKRN